MTEKDLAHLTISELLDLAIIAEEKAAQRYGEFAVQMERHQNPQAAVLFRQIQTREMEHVRQLRRHRDRFPSQPTTVAPIDFFNPAEASPYQESTHKLTQTEIYETALHGEERASTFYQKLTEILIDPQAKDLAHTLWTEELGHVEWVARQLRNLPSTPPT